MSKRKEALLFLKKKKFFAPSGRAVFSARVLKEQKFLRRFFQKAAASLSPLKPIKL
jgi:hypothetical protein